MDKTNAAPQGESNRVKDEPASTDEAQSLGAGNTHTCELPPAGAAPLTREEIENVVLHYIGREGDQNAEGMSIWIVRALCDMALRSLDAEDTKRVSMPRDDEIRLAMGELTADQMRTAKSAIRWVLSRQRT